MGVVTLAPKHVCLACRDCCIHNCGYIASSCQQARGVRKSKLAPPFISLPFHVLRIEQAWATCCRWWRRRSPRSRRMRRRR